MTIRDNFDAIRRNLDQLEHALFGIAPKSPPVTESPPANFTAPTPEQLPLAVLALQQWMGVFEEQQRDLIRRVGDLEKKAEDSR